MKKQRIQMVILSVVLLICCAGFFAARFYASAEEEKEKEKEEGIYTALSFEKNDLCQLTIVGEDGELALAYDGSAWSFVNDIDAEEAALQDTKKSESETSDDASTEGEETDSDEEASVTYEVNSSTANEILETLARLTSTNEVNHVTDMQPYGLDAPVLTVTITLQDDVEHTLEVGSRNEMISAYYIRVDGGDTVYTMSDSDYSLLNKTDTDVAQETAE